MDERPLSRKVVACAQSSMTRLIVRAVERMQRDQFAAARALAPKRRRVDKTGFKQHAQSRCEAMLAVGRRKTA